MEIGERIEAVRGRIAAAATWAGRDPAAVTLIGAVKGMHVSLVAEAIAAGLSDLGENFVQEAERHREQLVNGASSSSSFESLRTSGGVDARWHLIGHLQSNKAGAAARLFDTIQSIDSIRLARQLSDRASVPLKVLLEVNVAAEASKFGLAPSEVAATVSAAGVLANIELVGLMTIAPAAGDPELVRPVFQELRELAIANGLRALSMGMTDDFEVAVQEGATMVRIGRAIFGERPS